jgi:DNA repair photolyase
MVESGMAQDILLRFLQHVKVRQKLSGECRDTMMIVTKAGEGEIRLKSPNGSVLEILKQMPDNVQISSSITFFPREDMRANLEPGGSSKSDRIALIKRLRNEGILCQGAMVQPIFHVFIPDQAFWSELADAGINRAAIDIFTTTPENLALVARIIGCNDRDAEIRMWKDYLESNAPSKDGIRRGISVELQRQLYGKIVRDARTAGIEKVVYCRFVQMSIGLQPLNYGEKGDGGCMANITCPTPHKIRIARATEFGVG